MKILNANDILNVNDLPIELVEVPEWGGSVYVRRMTGTEKDQFEIDVTEKKGRKATVNLSNVRAKLCALTMVDENGSRLFGEKDVTSLGCKSAVALDRVFVKARELNGLTEKDVEELAKN